MSFEELLVLGSALYLVASIQTFTILSMMEFLAWQESIRNGNLHEEPFSIWKKGIFVVAWPVLTIALTTHWFSRDEREIREGAKENFYES